MSASLFRSKQHTSKKNLKKLTISAPLSSPNSVSSNFSSPKTPSTPSPSGFQIALPVVVLLAKYKFEAENEHEISVERKSYMKLIDRPGNGWLKVQVLDKFNQVGLIPASYVDIEVNDVLNPISIKWLNEYKDKSQTNEQVDDSEDLFDFENYADSAVIDQVLQVGSRRFWYKIRLTFSNNDQVYIGKTYEDFYNLHVTLTKKYDGTTLPKLPMPLRSASSPTNSTSIDRKFYGDLQSRRKNLQVYLNDLLSVPKYQKCSDMMKFIDTKQVRLTEEEVKEIEKLAKKTDENGEPQIDQEKHNQIANNLKPGSVDICKVVQSTRYFSPTAPLPPPLNKSASSTNLVIRNDQNVKYSSYIKRSEKSEPKKLVHSSSSNTLISYTSLIDVYDDVESTEEDVSTSYDESSKEHSLETKASSIEDEADEKADVNRSSVESAASANSTGPVVTPKAVNKQNHYSTNSSQSESDSIFSKHNSTPTTPVAPHLSFPSVEGDYNVNTPATPTTPILEDVEFEKSVSPTTATAKKGDARTPGSSHDYIKIKISLNNKEDDIVALRIKRTNLISIAYLKKLLSFKIYKDYNLTDHYKLQVVDRAGNPAPDMSDKELLDHLKASTKVNMKLERARV